MKTMGLWLEEKNTFKKKVSAVSPRSQVDPTG
jgi:hypothetical protein